MAAILGVSPLVAVIFGAFDFSFFVVLVMVVFTQMYCWIGPNVTLETEAHSTVHAEAGNPCFWSTFGLKASGFGAGSLLRRKSRVALFGQAGKCFLA
jgi:hypothetical protein